jgi:UDP-3-O-[3-hydroxymyristoyl] glucosamine N-acyltransferase
LQEALRSQAAAVLTRAEVAATYPNPDKPFVLVDNPRAAFVKVLETLAIPWTLPPGIHPSAVVEDGVQVGADVRIGAQVWIEAGAQIGNRVTIMAGTKIGADCTIGDGTTLYPNVVLYPRVKIGRGCLLHAGCVLGADGFGYIPAENGLRKVPHLGTVEVGDGVEVGANTCIDRAKTGATVIGSGTKIDNLVHIAHNVRIGYSSLLIAQTGVAGSVTIGNGVILAGQAGIADHITIGDGARVGAQGGVIGNIGPGESVSGYPARPHARKMREYAAVAALPDYVKRIRDLEKRLARLEAASQEEKDLS